MATNMGHLHLRAAHHAPDLLPFISYLAEEVERQGGEFLARRGSAQMRFGRRLYVIRRSKRKGTVRATRWGSRLTVAEANVRDLRHRLEAVHRVEEYLPIVLAVRRFVRGVRRDSE